MRLSGNTALVTGGATGIGFGIARLLAEAGSTVIVCGRRKAALEEARKMLPGLETRTCDLSVEAERQALAAWIAAEHPRLNVLVNNAGIQQRMGFGDEDFWMRARAEIAINLEAPIHLLKLLMPLLERNADAMVLNVSSGLAFVPMSAAPVYCATKAAVRSLTLCLRRQLGPKRIGVVEIIPPAVDTELGGPGLHRGAVPRDEFIAELAKRLAEGAEEIAYGFSAQMLAATREERERAFERMNPLP
jgi:uncharacterized oxidoreductase